jgi:long-chain acyl-CoA synthetase
MEKIWLKSYPEDIPAEINPDFHPSLVAMFEGSITNFAERPAICSLDCIMTYGELGEKTRDFAAFLQHRLKLQKGDRIAIMLPNVAQYHVAFFGALRAGLTIVNVNPLYTARELVGQLADSGAETIVVMANFAHVLQHALPETRVKNVIITEVADMCGFCKSIIINFLVRFDKRTVPPWHIPQTISFKRALAYGKSRPLLPVRLQADDIALLQYTGGTTGISKGAVLTHRNLLANVEQAKAWIGKVLQPGDETCLTALPLYHIFSLTICCLTFTRLGAFQLLIPNPRDLPGMVKSLQKYPVTVFIGLTTLFNGLVNTAQFRALDFSKLKLTVAGGMAVNPTVATKWQEVTGTIILEGYGLTEASPVVSIAPLNQVVFFSSIGIPVPSTEISIRDDDGNEVALGEEGELCVRGPQVMQCYWNKPDETAKVFYPDGWLRTGDIVVADEKGYLYLIDRKKDMIVVAGFNVYPNEVETVIASHPMVHEVAIVGSSSTHAGEVVKAFVVRKDESLTKEKLIAFCKDRLASYKVPKRVQFVAELPKSNVGKILRRALRDK